MERVHCEKYLGDKIDLGAGLAITVGKLADVSSSLSEEQTSSEDYIKQQAVSLFALESRRDWDMIGTSANHKLAEAIPEESKELANKLKTDGWDTRLNSTSTPDEVYEFTKDLYKEIYGEFESEDNETEEEQQPEPDSNGEGESTEAEAGDETQGEGEDKETSDKGKATEVRTEFETVPWEVLQHSEDIQGSDAEPTAGMSIDYSNYDNSLDKWEPASPDRMIEINLNKMKELPEPDSKYLSSDLDTRLLGNQIRKYIQVQTRSRLQTERKSGKIHKRNTFRVAIGTTDWNQRIFKTKTEGMSIDTCVTILVDWSGSMGGQKREVACAAASRILNVFDKSLHIPVELLTFSTRYDYSHYKGKVFNNGIVKAFSDTNYTDKDIAARFTRFTKDSGGNHDADALCWAAKRLAKRKEKRKILIVLSDGCPTCVEGGDAAVGLSLVTEDIQSRGDIDLYAIGILDQNVERFYNNYKVIESVSELDNVLLDTLKEAVIK